MSKGLKKNLVPCIAWVKQGCAKLNPDKNVILMILENGFYIIESRKLRLSTSEAEQFYAEHKGDKLRVFIEGHEEVRLAAAKAKQDRREIYKKATLEREIKHFESIKLEGACSSDICDNCNEVFHSVEQISLFMSSGPLWSHILCADDAIIRWRKLMGPTKVLKTIFDEPLSIRGLYD
ncbi:hypothetical protein Btru_067113 [Bulinus truncatus]|nr:hypothetical protein Btru_067113 [Bulinus truncatus]